MKILILGAGIAIFSFMDAVSAEYVYHWPKEADALQKQWSGRYSIKNVKKDSNSRLCIVVENSSNIVLKKYIPIDSAKKYTLSGEFKSSGKTPSKVFFGFITYDKNKKYIETVNSNIVPGTQTVLAAPANIGDKTLIVKDASKWKVHKVSGVYSVAFNAKPDFSDLPNRTLHSGVKKISKRGDFYAVELAAPLKRKYPAGIRIRQHTVSFGFYLYSVMRNFSVPAAWKKYSASAFTPKPGLSGWQYFRPGTVYVQIIILANYGQKKDAELAITGITLTDSDK